MHIIVIGAGIIGMTTAWRLAGDGHEVTVVDSGGGPGEGASHANGGQLSYSYVAPLADPSIWRQLPRLLLDPNSPVRFRPGLDPFHYAWLWRFLAACNRKQALQTIDRLGRLAALSREVLHGADDLSQAEFCWSRTGKLVVYSSAQSFAAARRHAEHQAASGIERQVLDRAACLELEPALAGIAHRLVGGLFSPGDEAGDALRLCREIEVLLARRPGAVRFLYNTRVQRVLCRGKRAEGLQTSAGELHADLYVLAAGIGARALATTAGVALPIRAIKGYSLSAPIAAPATAPRVSITDAARKVVLARLGETLRLAGAADLVGETTEIDRRRTDRLIADARHDFPEAADWTSSTLWAGLRPATPKGAPIIGESGIESLLLNVGHGALGFTLALGSAELLAGHIGSRALAVSVDDFALGEA